VGYHYKWRRHKDTSKMLLTVSSFGESFRRAIPGGSIFKGFYDLVNYFLGPVAGSEKTGRTIKKELPFPTVDSTQMRP
jgi:hypothetical protein